MSETIVTLGLSFSAEKTESQVSSLIKKFDELADRAGSIQSAFDNLFGAGLAAKISQANRLIGKFNSALAASEQFAQNISNSLLGVSTAASAVNRVKLNPVDSAAATNIHAVTQEMNTAATAITTLSKSLDLINTKLQTVTAGGKDATASLNQVSVSQSQVNSVVDLNSKLDRTVTGSNAVAENLTRAFGAASVLNYLKKATAKSVAFGQELAYINSLAVDFDTRKIGKGIMEFDSPLGDPQKNAEAFYYAYSSGVRGNEEQIVEFTKKMSETAKVIRANVIPTMDAATSAMNAYNMSAKDGTELSDLFFSIVKWGKAKGEQLASGLGQVISTSATAGLSLNEMGASITHLTKVMQTRNAITFFNNMLSKMIKPTKGSRLAAEALGIELGLTALRAKGFTNVMAEIREKTKDNQEALLQIFPDLRGQRAALQLLNKGWEDYQLQLQNFENKAGSAAEAMAVLRDNIDVQLGALPTTLGKIALQTGSMVAGILTLGGALAPVLHSFNNMSDGAQKFFAAITLVTGGIILYKSAVVAMNSVKAMMIRNNDTINAQKAKEAAATAVLTNETASSTAATKAIVDLRRQELELAVLKAKADLAEAQSARAAGLARQAEIAERRALNAQKAQESVVGKLKNAGLVDTPNYQIQIDELRKLEKAHEQANMATLKAMDVFEKSNLTAYDTAQAYKKTEQAILEKAAAQNAANITQAAAGGMNQQMAMASAAETDALKKSAAVAREKLSALQAENALRIKEDNARVMIAGNALKEAQAKELLEQETLAATKASVDHAKAKLDEASALSQAAKKARISNEQNGYAAGGYSAELHNKNISDTNNLKELQAARKKATADYEAAKAAQVNAQKTLETASASTVAASAKFAEARETRKVNIAAIQNAAATSTMTAAESAANVQNQIRIKSLYEKATMRANDIAQEYQHAQAIGNTAALEGIATRLKHADARAEKLKNLAMTEGNALLLKNNVLKKINNSLTQEGVVSGTAATAINLKGEALKAFQEGTKFGSGWRDFGSALTGVGAAAGKAQISLASLGGKIVGFLSAVFSFTTGLAVVAVGMADLLQSLWRTGDGLEKSIILQPFANWIMGVGNALKNLEAQDTHFDSVKSAYGMRNRANDFLTEMQKGAVDDRLPDMSIPEQLQTLTKRQQDISNALRQFDEQTLKTKAEEVRNIAQRLTALVNDQFDGDFSKAQQSTEYKELNKSMDAAQKNYEKYEDGWRKQNDAMREVVRQQKSILNTQREARESIQSMIDEQRIKAMSPDEQSQHAQKILPENIKDFYRNLKFGYADVAEKSFKAIIDNYNKIRENAVKKLEENQKLLDSVNKMDHDISMKYAKSDQERMDILHKQAIEYAKTTDKLKGSGDLAGSWESFQKAFAAEEQRAALMSKMADAERSANESTLKLIQSMDKFKSYAMNAVSAGSTEAIKLQSRRFDRLPNFQPVTTQQSQYENHAAQMKSWYEKTAESLKTALKESSERATAEKEKYDNEWKSVVEGNKNAMDHLDTTIEQLVKCLSRGIGINSNYLAGLGN